MGLTAPRRIVSACHEELPESRTWTDSLERPKRRGDTQNVEFEECMGQVTLEQKREQMGGLSSAHDRELKYTSFYRKTREKRRLGDGKE